MSLLTKTHNRKKDFEVTLVTRLRSEEGESVKLSELDRGKKYYLTKMGSHFLGLQLEDKTQIDIILPMIKQLVSQKSAAF